VFGSEFIGLKYSVRCKFGLATSNNQSIINQKIFAKMTNTNNHQVKNNILFEKSLLGIKSLENFLMVLTSHIPVLFKTLDFFFKALLNNSTITSKNTIKIQVEKIVFVI
jgi:hypothetical protein